MARQRVVTAVVGAGLVILVLLAAGVIVPSYSPVREYGPNYRSEVRDFLDALVRLREYAEAHGGRLPYHPGGDAKALRNLGYRPISGAQVRYLNAEDREWQTNSNKVILVGPVLQEGTNVSRLVASGSYRVYLVQTIDVAVGAVLDSGWGIKGMGVVEMTRGSPVLFWKKSRRWVDLNRKRASRCQAP